MKHFNSLNFTRSTFAILLALTLNILSLDVRSQALSTYCFSPSSGTYTPIAGGTPLATIQTDDAINGTSVPIGFTFTLAGNNYTHIWPSSNCWFKLGDSVITAPANTYNFAYNAAAAYPIMMPFSHDAYGGGNPGQGAAASYLTTGTAPNRVFTMEWLNWNSCCTTTPAFSVQVKLYEAGGVFEYIYRQEPNAATINTPRIGVAMSAVNFLALNNSNATPTMLINTDAVAPTGVKPATGQVYRFAPPSALTYQSSTSIQNATSVSVGTTNAQILSIPVEVSGCIGSLSLSQLSFNTTGTTNTANILNAKVYYTGSSAVFSSATQFGSTVNAPNGNFSVSGSQSLSGGTNYFWLAYDVAGSATNGNLLDAECTQITVGGTPYVPTATAPSGAREIKAPLNGVYTVGSSGAYPTLTAALSDVSALGVVGPVTFELTNSIYSSATGEVFPITISGIPGINASRPLVIKPANNNTPWIVDSMATSLFIIENAKYISFDGRWNAGDNGRNMTIENKHTSASANVFMFRNEASVNTIRNTIIRYASSSTSTAPANAAIFVGGTTNLTGSGNDSLVFKNNTIAPSGNYYYGTAITFVGQSLTQQNDWATIDSNWIYGNRMMGVYLANTNSGNGRQFLIRGNSFYDTVATAPHPVSYTGTHASIYLNGANTASWGHQVIGNFIGGTEPLAAGGRQYINPGSATIYQIFYNASNVTGGARIANNRVSNQIYNQGGTPTFYYPYLFYVNSGYVDITDNIIGDPADTNNIRFENNSGVCMYMMYMFHSAPTRINRNRISNILVNSNTAMGFVGIYHSTTTIGEAYIDSNIINKVFTRSTSTSSTTCAAFMGLFISNSSTTHYIRGNQIGGANVEDSVSTFTSSPLNPTVSTPSATIMNGIYNNAGIAQISNNYIGNLYTNSNGTGTSTSASLVGIHQASGTGGGLVNNNIVSDMYSRNVSASNSVYGITSLSAASNITGNIVRNLYTNSIYTGTTTAGSLNGIHVSSSQVHNILNNTVTNLNSAGIASTQTNGILASVNAQNLIRGNRVSGLYSFTTNPSTSTSAGIVGINNVSGALNQVVDSNTITDLVSTNNGASVNPSVIGLVFNGNSTVVGNSSAVTKNRIWGLTHTYPSAPTPTTALQYGIQITNGTVTVANNLIRLGRDTSGAIQLRPGQYRGILSTANSNQIRVYHNNILVEFGPDYGAGGAPNPSTGCIEFNANAFAPGFIDVRNNIFVNSSVNSGSSTLNHYNEMYSTSTALLTTNANLLNNTPSANTFVGRFAGVNYTSLDTFRMNTRQAGSTGIGNPNFIAPNASTSGVDLRVGNTNAIEGMGDTTLLSVVSTDFDGRARASFGPADIGASAGNYALNADVVAPFIYYTPLSNASSLAPRVFSATIYDGGNIPYDTATGPRVYFKKSVQATWVSTPGIFVSGSTKNRVYNFTIDHSLIGGVLPGDVVQYFIIAADSSAGNRNSNPAFALATTVNNVIAAPAAPNSYLFNDPIATTVYIGTGAGTPSYPTLTGSGGFFEAVNNSALQGNTTVLVQANTTEPGTFELNKWLEVGAGGYQLTIRPVDNTQRVLSGTAANGNGLIRFNNTDNVKILGWHQAGTNADTNLVIRSSSTTTPALGLVNGGAIDTFQNVIFESRVSSTANGILYIPSTATSATRGVSNVFVDNCYFRQDLTGTTFAPNGIYALGTSPRFNTNITVNNSKFINCTQSGVLFTTGTGDNIRITNNHFYYNYGINNTTSINVININPGFTTNNNIISGNYIGGSDVFAGGSPWVNNASVTFNGITLNTGTAGGTSVSNNIIQNIQFTSTTNTGTLTGIIVQGTSAVYSVTGNRIGSYTLPIYSTNNSRFIGINTTTTGNINVQNDTIINIRVINTGTTAAITGILTQSGSTNVVNVSNNYIADLFTTSSNTGTGNTTCALIGIASTHSTLNLTITNNTIRTLGVPTSANHLVRGIWVSSGTPTISGNTVYGISSNSTYTGTLTIAAVTGISSTTTFAGLININNNVVDSVWRTGTSVSSQMIGILYNSGGTQTANVNGNTVRNLNLVSSSTGTTTSSALVGIMVSAAATINGNYNDNRISVLNHLSNSASSIVGMYLSTSVSVVGNNTSVSRNLIHSLRSDATSAVTNQNGIQLLQGFITFTNNMIRVGIDSAGVAHITPTVVRGILHQNSTQANYYHNTVLVGGAPASGTSNTAAFERSTSITSGQQIDIRNNIFANIASNNGGTGMHFGVIYFDSLRTVSNYNIIHTPGTGGMAGRITQSNTNYSLLGNDSTSWKANVGLDMTSSNVNPNFSADALGAAPNVVLTLQANNPAERSGDLSLTSVTTDYFNNARSSLSVSDIGAHADNFNMSPDAFPPVVSYTALTNAGSLTGTRALNNVTITDNNGIVTSGANRPKIYYSRDGLTWLSASASSVTGTATNASANFIIDYLAFSPALTLADTIRYFVVAQDAAGNLQSFPALAVGTDVNTITQYPRNPSKYSFLPVIAANTVIPVGVGQTYTSLTNAGGLFEFINSRTLGGNVFVEITSDITNETGAVQLNKFAEDGPGAGTFTLTIRPDAATVTPRLIQGSFQNIATTNGLITLVGADRVKITGIPAGGNSTQRLLRFRNTAATGSYAANSGNGLIVISSATGVTVRNCILESGNSNTAGGTIEFRVGNNNQYLTTPCSFDTVTNCIMTNNTLATLPNGIPANAGFYSFGAANVYNNNIVFTNNEVSNFVTAGVGVVGNNGDGFVITGNSFYYNLGFVPNITGTFQAIVFIPGAFSSGNTISNNFIGGSAANCGGTAWTNPNNIGFYGVRSNVGNGANTIISNNTIQNLAFTNTAATGVFHGIRAEAGNTSITNNLIGHPTNTNSILWSTSGQFYGVYYLGVNNVTLQNNAVQGVNMNTANVTPQFIGMYLQSGSVVGQISGNTVGHQTTANSISISSNTTHYGMLISISAAYSSTINISNNLIANMTGLATGTGGVIYGMLVQNTAFPTIANNTIHNIRSASITNSTVGVSVGLYLSTSSATATVLNNTIYAIRATNTGSTPNTSHGIYQNAGQDNVIRGNRIYDITNASSSANINPAPGATGINIAGASNYVYIQNNQITLGNGETNNIQFRGIWLSTGTTAVTMNATNNSILIDGSAASGVQNTYAILRGNNAGTELNTNINLRNNILINRRTGGSGNHYVLANQTTAPTNTTWSNNTSAYNLLSTSNTSAVGEWGLLANNLSDWRINSSSDVLSYYVQAGNGAGQLNANNLFTNISNGNLGLQTANPEVWYVYGKGITGASVDNLNIDFAGTARSTSQGTATTIGSIHMSTAPSSLPIAATASAAPAANTTTSYIFANRPVASITWGASAPTTATVYDFTGVNPPSSPAGNFNNRYVRIDVTGGTTPYNYGITYNFNAANLGGMLNANNLRLATAQVAVPTSWTTQFTTTSNSSTGVASVGGISSTGSNITFTGTELTAPPTIIGFTPSARQVGGAVTIRGSLFTGATAVSFNGTAQPTFTVVNDTTITTTVPVGATTGPVSVTNAYGTGTSASNFIIIPAPTISSFSPGSGTFGTSVTVTGTGFTWATAVKFNGVSTPFTVVSNTTITTTVPNGATSGNIRVINPADSVESTNPFNVFGVPTVTSFTPGSGSVGASVSITGTGFNAVTAVRFNGVNASYTVNSSTDISATVPVGASTGTISVTNGSGTGTSGSNFTVTTPPTINSFSPSAGGPGSTVVITGTNFTGADTIRFNGTLATTFTVNSSTQITVTVPAGATTGTISVRTPQGLAVSSGTYTVYTDLVVSTNMAVNGLYNSVTVTSTGTANLTGTLTALGNVVVQTGGTMNFGTNVLDGLGNFTAQSGSRLIVGSSQGLLNAGIGGNIQVNGTRSINTGASVEFNGTGNQNTGNLITNIDTLIVNVATGDLIMQNNLTVNNRLDFAGSSIVLGANHLTIGANGSIVNVSGTKYVKTNGSGTLRRNVLNNATNVAFPVGSPYSYTPAQVQLTAGSTADIFTARVDNGVLSNGTTGSTLSSSIVNRTWVINELVAGGSNATITLTWDDSLEIGGFARANSGVFYTNAGGWVRPTTFGAATGTNPYSRSRSGMTTFGAFAVGDSLASTTGLPVQLLNLSANKVAEDVVVNWSTASEINNSHFEIERSLDGKVFESVGQVDGKGFSSMVSNYQFVDEKATLNKHVEFIYYRLKQVDFDGQFTYFGPVSVNISKPVVSLNVNVFPNPFGKQVTVSLTNTESGNLNIIITDMQGRTVYSENKSVNAGVQTLTLDGVENLKDGVYFMNANLNGQVTRVKLIKAGN